jgi:hypothetical protein
VLVAVGAVVLLDRDEEPKRPVTAPTVAPAKPKPRPTPKPKPKPKPAVKPTPKKPVAARTYSAPPQGVPITGRVVDLQGRPVAGAKVGLTRHEGFLEGLTRGIAMLASLGLVCIGEDTICEVPYGQGISNADGRYTVFLKPEVDDYDLNIEAQGSQVQSRIDFAGKPVTLPQLTLWNPTPRLEISGREASVVFAGVPASLGAAERYNAVVTDRRTGTELAVLRGVGSREKLDARLLEDAPLRLRVSGLVQTKLGDTWYSGHAEAQGRLVPPSRGKGCLTYLDGTLKGRNTAACRKVTDGAFTGEWSPTRPACAEGKPCEQAVAVDLGSVRDVRYVRVLGCYSFGKIQGSNDGKTWRTLEDGGCGGEVSGKARYVRVAGAFTENVTEISVWY